MRRPIRPCLHREPDGRGCPNLTEGSWCIEHAPASTSPTTAVSQSRAHRRKRARLVAQLPLPCAICGEMIYEATDMQAHHTIAVASGGANSKVVATHARCNARRGARTG